MSNIEDVFKILAGSKGTLLRSELADALRALGFAPTMEELPNGETFTYERLLQEVNAHQMPNEAGDDALAEAFRTFDKSGQGVLIAKEFCGFATVLGEPFSQGEVDAFMAHADGEPLFPCTPSARPIARTCY